MSAIKIIMRVPSGASAVPAEWPAANLPRASRIPRSHTRLHTYTATHAHRMRRCQVGSRSIHSQQSTQLPAMFMFLALPPPAPALPAPCHVSFMLLLPSSERQILELYQENCCSRLVGAADALQTNCDSASCTQCDCSQRKLSIRRIRQQQHAIACITSK